MARDNFPRSVIDTVAKRAGQQCSKCKRLTVGPTKDPNSTVMLGVAANIRAASPGGPRYGPAMTAAQRKSITNAIWLCQDDAKLIDDDERAFTVDVLKQIKAQHEEDVRQRLASAQGPGTLASDQQILDGFAAVFDRPALTEPFGNCRQPDFQKAISDIIETLNTGIHRLRDGTEVRRLPSRHDLRAQRNREVLADIVGMLGDVRALHWRLLRENAVQTCGCTCEEGSAARLDDQRRRILEAFRRINPRFAARLRTSPNVSSRSGQPAWP